MFVNEKIRQESFVKIYEIYIFISTTKIKVDKNAHNYIQFRFDVQFSEYDLAVEFDEKEYTD